MQDQGITVFFSWESGRQSRQCGLLFYDLIGDVLQLYSCMSLYRAHRNSAFSVISQSIPRILHGEGIQEGNTLPVILRRYKGGFTGAHQIYRCRCSFGILQFSAVIYVSHKILLIYDRQQIAGVLRI